MGTIPISNFNIKANKCPFREQILITYLAGANMRDKKNGYTPLEKNGDCPLFFYETGRKKFKKKKNRGKTLPLFSALYKLLNYSLMAGSHHESIPGPYH